MTPSEQDGRRNGTAEKVAEHLDQGLTVLEIARLLNISPQAVYKHVKNLGRPTPTRVSS